MVLATAHEIWEALKKVHGAIGQGGTRLPERKTSSKIRNKFLARKPLPWSISVELDPLSELGRILPRIILLFVTSARTAGVNTVRRTRWALDTKRECQNFQRFGGSRTPVRWATYNLFMPISNILVFGL